MSKFTLRPSNVEYKSNKKRTRKKGIIIIIIIITSYEPAC